MLYAIIAVCFGVLLLLGVLASRHVESLSDYFGMTAPGAGFWVWPRTYPFAFHSFNPQNSTVSYPFSLKSSAAREARAPPFQKNTSRTSRGMSDIRSSSRPSGI